MVAVLLGGFGTAQPASSAKGIPVFTDVTAGTGIQFTHISGPVDRKDYIFESKGGGLGLFDFDNDGWIDLFLVQGATVETAGTDSNQFSRLYRNRGDWTFEDVTEKAGITQRRWGMGVSFADYNNDGFVDIYQTCFGPNVLYRNNGNGTFTDVTAEAGVGDPLWSTSSAFGDYDRDGDLDLYVANYLDYAVDRLPPQSPNCAYLGRVVMCGPRGLNGATDSFYRNNGDGTFSEVSKETGAFDADRFFGLGVVWTDIDFDQDLDLYVSNDATPNYLFLNDGHGKFEEMGFLTGLAVSGDGAMQASMGIDVADFDNDLLLDLFVTHFASDYSTLYRNQGDLIFRDVTAEAKLQRPEWLLVAWSTKFIDFDNDGWKDIFHVNGHVYPFLLEGGSKEEYLLPSSLYMNLRDGTFADARSQGGAALSQPLVGRGAAFGDIDNDGDFDIAIANLNRSPLLLRNDRTDSNHWVFFRVTDAGAAEPLGARLKIKAGELEQIAEVRRTVGIYSASDPRVHFGIGGHTEIQMVEVSWLDGAVSRFEKIKADRHYVIDRQQGIRPEEFREP